jgi:CelD/BcsL family acetyltransferase involved in cellulose biosynthesis
LKICSAEDLWSDYLDFIALPGEEKTVSDAVFRYLFNEKKHWVAGVFENLLGNSNLVKFKNDYCAETITISRHTSVCPYLKITGSFDEYMKQNFKRKKRYNLKRQIRRVLDEKNAAFIQVTSTEDLASRIDKLFELHAERFREKRQSSTFDSLKTRKFLQKFSRLASEMGILDFYLLCDSNEPISAIYGLRYGNKHYYYQSGADTSWGKYSVGTVLLNLVIEKCFGDGLDEFDFLKGTEAYKASWMSRQRREHQIKMYRRSVMGYLLYVVPLIRPLLKKCFNLFHR